MERRDRLGELLRRSHRIAGGPELGRPFDLDVVAVDDVVEDVGLGEPNVLEQVPGRVLDVRRMGVDRLVGEIGDGVVERHPRVEAIEEPDELLAKVVGVGHSGPPSARTCR